MHDIVKDGVRNLFPEFYLRRNYYEKRDYVESVMCRMARDGELYLTEIMLQTAPIPDIAGDVIFGRGYDSDSKMQVSSIPVEPEIEDYRVKLEAINGQNPELLEIQVGKKVTSTRTIENAKLSNKNRKVRIAAPVSVRIRDLSSVPLGLAYTALKTCGRYTSQFTSEASRARNCKVMEVPPWQRSHSESKAAKR